MITQRCPKCRSNRIRRGYRHTSVISKLIFRYNLLCDACNWEFSGFAIPFEIETDTKKQNLQEKASVGINRTNEYWSESVARDSQSNASQYAELETVPSLPATEKPVKAKAPAARGATGAKPKLQRSKRSRKRDEKIKKTSSSVTSRNSQDDVARKRTSAQTLDEKESGKHVDKGDHKDPNAKSRTVVRKLKAMAATAVGEQSSGQRKSSVTAAAKPRSKPKTGKAANTPIARSDSETGQISESVSGGQEPVKRLKKGVRATTVKKKSPVKNVIRKKPVNKASL